MSPFDAGLRHKKSIALLTTSEVQYHAPDEVGDTIGGPLTALGQATAASPDPIAVRGGRAMTNNARGAQKRRHTSSGNAPPMCVASRPFRPDPPRPRHLHVVDAIRVFRWRTRADLAGRYAGHDAIRGSTQTARGRCARRGGVDARVPMHG